MEEGKLISLALRTAQLRSPGNVYCVFPSVLNNCIPQFVQLLQKPHKLLVSTQIDVFRRGSIIGYCSARVLIILASRAKM